MSRPTWDEWGLALARAVSTRADCSVRQVGAVLMSDDHAVLTTGYNGAPAFAPGCLTMGACPRAAAGVAPGSSYDTGPGACIALHAEQNALLRASRTDMVGSTLYVTDKPCDGCRKMISGTPIIRVVYPELEYAIRGSDGRIVVGPGWRCMADVMASGHGFGTRIPGTLVSRELSTSEWKEVVHGDQ